MERNVVTLATAQKLKAAGFPQKAFSVWEWSAGIPAGEAYLIQPELIKRYGLWGSQDIKESVAAPTAQEIADQLLGNVKLYRSKKWFASDAALKSEIASSVGEADTMAEALAQLWIKLQEEK